MADARCSIRGKPPAGRTGWTPGSTRSALKIVAMLGATAALSLASPALGQVVITDINPDQSTLDPVDPDGATGGRVNGLASVPGDPDTYYAASEWGGLYKTTDFTNAGGSWFRLEDHVPMVTWDVEVNPRDPERVYATSFYDGRVVSRAGINVSTDAGATWEKPASAVPPEGFCEDSRRDEPSAFGIAVDRDNPDNVYIGTNCGLAVSNDRGASWTFVDPTPDDPAEDVWDVVVHHQGIIDTCGQDGHARSTDAGASWTLGAGLPMTQRCSIDASPHERNVLFSTAGTNIFETDNGGASWTNIGTPDSRRQGRIPFVAVNERGPRTFDLWFGDVRLYRGSCTSGGSGLRCPMAVTGPPQPAPPPGWAGPFTRSAGAHDDVAAILFDPTARRSACPTLFSNDGGVYFNTLTDDPGCHTPAWEQPRVTPHALWLWAMDKSDQPGADQFDIYAGAQDNGTFATTDGGAPKPSWVNSECCDGFDDSAAPSRVLYTVCCFSNPATRIFRRGQGMAGGGMIPNNSYPDDGLLPGFRFPDVMDRFAATSYVMITQDCTPGSGGCSGAAGGDGGVWVTTDASVDPIAWTELGNATEPPSNALCAVKSAVSGGTPTFYVQTGACDGRLPDALWRFDGTMPAGVWQRIDTNLPSGGVGIFDVDPNDPERLYISNITPTGPRMMFSTDGGTTWQPDTALDDLMTGSGQFHYQNVRGPTRFTGFGGYPQPTFVAFDTDDPDLMAAGGADSGLFFSDTGGASWSLVSDPHDPATSGTPHIPRPRFGVFDNEPEDRVDLYVGTQGKGVLRVSIPKPKVAYKYAAKIVCGRQPDPTNMRLVRGFYGTAINIFNPGPDDATFTKRLSLTFPPDEQRPGEVYDIAEDKLAPDQALEVDCEDVRRRLFPNGLPAPYIKGFVSIESTVSLDVTAVYTSAALVRDECCEVRPGAHSSIDVEQIAEREVERRRPPPRERPDLVPEPAFPPAPPNAPGSLPQDYCAQPPDGGPRAEQIRVNVRNQGEGPAGMSMTSVEFMRPGGGPVGTATQMTGPLAAGAVEAVDFVIPRQCYPGSGAGCNFVITVDDDGQVDETNEANNTDEEGCPGIAP